MSKRRMTMLMEVCVEDADEKLVGRHEAVGLSPSPTGMSDRQPGRMQRRLAFYLLLLASAVKLPKSLI